MINLNSLYANMTKEVWVIKVPIRNLRVGKRGLAQLVQDWLSRRGLKDIECSEVTWSDVDGEIIVDCVNDPDHFEHSLVLTKFILDKMNIEYKVAGIDFNMLGLM